MSDGWNYDLSQAESHTSYLVSSRDSVGEEWVDIARLDGYWYRCADYTSVDGVYAFRDLPEPAPLPQEAK